MAYIGRRGLLTGATGALVTAAAGPAGAAQQAGAAAERGAQRGARRAEAPAPRAEGKGATAAEFRGMWIATVENVDWPSESGLSAGEQRAELLALLDTAVERRLNAVILQVRPTADSMWPAAREPWSQWLSGEQGVDPGWDPLGTAVAEAHARGLELHAWFNPYRVANHTDLDLLAPSHPARRNPEWTVPYGGKTYYNPGLPDVRLFVQEAMLDAVSRYAVDGVHWDDYFYPYPVEDEYFDDDEAYEAYGGSFSSRGDWRRNNTDTLVREMSERLAKVRPAARFGVSPFAIWRNDDVDPAGSPTRAGIATYDDLYADTRKWVTEGWIDYIVPQAYWHIGHPTADYAAIVPWWARTVAGTSVQLYVGEALYRCDPDSSTAAWRDPAELSRHVRFARGYAEVRGHAYFSAKQVVADPNGAMARVVADHYPTAVPPR
ncbi:MULTISPECIES: glycoside hydrolase family 10 protein [unclassified Streptomyces]|uniref:glycoside hydrolase family 10 protein n=1 Tax=unclassified Streptomyces TaxID=2593676 RepID=UPI001BEAB99A|nr:MULTISPECIES: family 10 glycosylhydrolase [unclassified Streptomyces]MBT2403692.1 family 10 glycosylhydrolase [Streptomyces sp. ISL-21]MBT2611251.1 family 10 glycosylhydrolase [Streptomyces sp. ISL-87]